MIMKASNLRVADGDIICHTLSRICHTYCAGNPLVICLVADVADFLHATIHVYYQAWAFSFYKKEKNILNIHFFCILPKILE